MTTKTLLFAVNQTNKLLFSDSKLTNTRDRKKNLILRPQINHVENPQEKQQVPVFVSLQETKEIRLRETLIILHYISPPLKQSPMVL